MRRTRCLGWRPALGAALFLAAAARLGSAQLDWPTARAMLADADRDEARELALRSLAFQADSPAQLLRDWAAGGDWRQQEALLRVLGERGELSEGEVAAALRDPRWVVRAAAARAAGHSTRTRVGAELQRLLADAWPAVREAALAALYARGELKPESLAAGLRAPGTRDVALAIVTAAARPFDSVVRDGLGETALRDELLGRLRPDAGPETAAVLAWIAGEKAWPCQTRAKALLALPASAWPGDPVPIVLGGLGEAGGGSPVIERLAALLDAPATARLLDGVIDDPDDERFRARIGLVRHLPASAVDRLLRATATCPPDRLGDCLRLLARLEAPGLAARAAEVLGSPQPEAVWRPWLSEVGRQVAADPGTRPVLARFLEGEGDLAASAFRILVGQRAIDERVLAFARRRATDAPANAQALLGAAAETPARHWLDLLGHQDPGLRWTAAKGLLPHLGAAGVARALTVALRSERAPQPRAAMVSTVLLTDDAAVALDTIAWIVAQGDADLDRTLLGHLMAAKQPWLATALRSLEGSRLAAELPRLRARHGDRPAARACLKGLPAMSAPQARALREPLARCLEPGDLPQLERWLGASPSAAPSWLREETLVWLRQRRDLEATAMLERALGDDWLEVRALSAAALVERGRTEHLLPLIDAWVEGDEDVEAILSEVLGALPATCSEPQARFLVRLLVAPVLVDPERQMAVELTGKALAGRIDSLYPLLRPTIEACARIDRQSFARLLAEELQTPRLRTAWACASKDYLLRGLRLAAANPPALEVLEPILDWALRLSPRRPELDGPLLLIAGAEAARRGHHELAATTLRQALATLALARLPARGLEQLAQETLDSGSTDGLAAVAAFASCSEAVVAARRDHREAALVAARLALSLAREDAAFSARLAAELERWIGPLPKRPERN